MQNFAASIQTLEHMYKYEVSDRLVYTAMHIQCVQLAFSNVANSHRNGSGANQREWLRATQISVPQLEIISSVRRSWKIVIYRLHRADLYNVQKKTVSQMPRSSVTKSCPYFSAFVCYSVERRRRIRTLEELEEETDKM